MESDWPTIKIGAFAKAKGGKRLPKGSTLQEANNNHPYIRVLDFTTGEIKRNSLLYVPDNVANVISRYKVQTNDVIISIVGTVGAIAEVPKELNGANLTENAARLNFLDDSVNSSYVAYYLKSPIGQHEITINAVGSTQLKLPLYGIENINVIIPPISEQNAIVQTLSAFDNKIRLNRQMNETLEAMARAIFKSWFVDFDPVRAKMNGQKPYGMDDQTAALFPDSFEDSPISMIPKGWKVHTLPEVIEVNPKRILKKGARAPYLDMANMK